MRSSAFWRVFGILLSAVSLLGLLIPVSAEQTSPYIPFPRQNATIALSDSAMTISPEALNPGPTMFKITNNSDIPRGVYITGNDRTGTPVMVHSSLIQPGETAQLSFWLDQGNKYAFHDFTSSSIVNDRMQFKSTYLTVIDVPVKVAIRHWRRYELQEGSIVISNSGIDVQPQSTVHGPIQFTVKNDTNKARGIVIAGEDRSGSTLLRHTPIIEPGRTAKVNFWLYEGRNYSIMDYTGSVPAAGRPFNSSFKSALSVEPGLPEIYGAGPSTKNKEGSKD